MPKKLLFVFKLAFGHMQLSIAISKTIQKLYGDKYAIYFAVNQTYKEIIEKLTTNVNFVLFDPVSTDGNENLQGGASDWLNKFGDSWRERDLVKFNLTLGHPYWKFYADCREYYPHITRIIQEIKPDLVLVDNLMASPLGIDQGIPSVQILSTGPALFGDESLPPPRSGLPGDYTEENVRLWKDFIEKTLKNEDYLKFLKETNDWMKETNCPVNIDGKYYCNTPGRYLNVYNWPLELDYAKMKGNWVRMDSSITEAPDPSPIPDKLAKLPGKLIYFSLGSISSCYKPLMTRLLRLLGEIEHRFIVSLGPIGDQYAGLLSANQYGENFLNQLSVLQMPVDVFITHAGNNSVTESCHFGVPMIACPLFGDQHNNAKRIEEKNMGRQLDPFTCTKSDLEQAIEFCLREDVRARMRAMSDRIKRDNNLKSVCEAIVSLVN